MRALQQQFMTQSLYIKLTHHGWENLESLVFLMQTKTNEELYSFGLEKSPLFLYRPVAGLKI